MKKYIFPIIIATSALSISVSAAYYSINGLSMLFAGASLSVIIMASSLEISKLVTVSFLYQYWDLLNKILKTYLITAVTVLMLITSVGIYGFLSSAYQTTVGKEDIINQQIISLENKKSLYEDIRNNINDDKQYLYDFRNSLSKNSLIQYTDKNNNVLTRTNKEAIKNIEIASKSEEKILDKLNNINDSIFNIENKLLEIRNNSETTSELGPLKYISNLTGKPMDVIVNWLLLIIILVFDPLALSLVLAANFALNQSLNKKTKNTTIIENVEEIKNTEELENVENTISIESENTTPFNQMNQYIDELSILNKKNHNNRKKREKINQNLDLLKNFFKNK